MGFLSFSSKNKQESTDDGNYVARDDENALVRSKRASSAGDPAERRPRDRKNSDPVLPEKKRARRRLVGAIALAMAVAIGLPMVLDSEPRPAVTNIDIQIPSKEKAPPQPLPRAVADAEALDAREEIVDDVAASPPEPAAAPEPTPAAPVKAEVKPEVRAPSKPVEPKPAVKADPKPEPKPAEPKLADPKPADKRAEKLADKPAEKPAAKPKPVEEKKPAPEKKPVKAEAPKEADRAIAILEGKADDKPDNKPAAPSTQKFVVQVAALASQDKVDELQGRLRAAGISSYTRKTMTESGERIRVQIGPFSKEEADKVRAKLKGIGMSGMMIAN